MALGHFLSPPARLRLQGFRGRWEAARPSVAYHLLAAAVLLYASRAGKLLPTAALLAFCPSLLKVAWSIIRPAPKSVSVRRIGIIEVCFTATFFCAGSLERPLHRLWLVCALLLFF